MNTYFYQQSLARHPFSTKLNVCMTRSVHNTVFMTVYVTRTTQKDIEPMYLHYKTKSQIIKPTTQQHKSQITLHVQ